MDNKFILVLGLEKPAPDAPIELVKCNCEKRCLINVVVKLIIFLAWNAVVAFTMIVNTCVAGIDDYLPVEFFFFVLFKYSRLSSYYPNGLITTCALKTHNKRYCTLCVPSSRFAMKPL